MTEFSSSTDYIIVQMENDIEKGGQAQFRDNAGTK